jgi:hypothetical protein
MVSSIHHSVACDVYFMMSSAWHCTWEFYAYFQTGHSGNDYIPSLFMFFDLLVTRILQLVLSYLVFWFLKDGINWLTLKNVSSCYDFAVPPAYLISSFSMVFVALRVPKWRSFKHVLVCAGMVDYPATVTLCLVSLRCSVFSHPLQKRFCWFLIIKNAQGTFSLLVSWSN